MSKAVSALQTEHEDLRHEVGRVVRVLDRLLIDGEGTITFTNGNSATFAYTVTLPGSAPVTQTKTVTRQVFRTPGTVCR